MSAAPDTRIRHDCLSCGAPLVGGSCGLCGAASPGSLTLDATSLALLELAATAQLRVDSANKNRQKADYLCCLRLLTLLSYNQSTGTAYYAITLYGRAVLSTQKETE